MNAVIYSASEQGFWSNEDGWGHIETATIFTEEETETLNLPLSSNNDAQWLVF